MKDENINNSDLSDFFKNLPEKVSVLEEQIDLKIQMEYFDASKRIKEDPGDENFFEKKDLLFSDKSAVFEKKIMLVQLASLENIEAFRTIEKFKNNSSEELKEWAILAYLESKTLIENSLSNEHQVIISTGLGGKGTKLRYFVVFISRYNQILNDLQQRLVGSELKFTLDKYDGDIEKITFYKGFLAIICLIPLRKPVKEIFSATIKECNLYGDFLKENYIITNIQIMNEKQIQNVLDDQDDEMNFGNIDLNRWK